MTTLEHIKSDNIRRCIQQARLGHNDAALRLMGFADGCIREARRFIDADSGNLGSYMGVEPLKPFIDSGLILGELLEFSIPGTQFTWPSMTHLSKQQKQVIEDLKARITRARDGSTSDGVIHANLIAEGWPRGAVDEAFGVVRE